MFFRTVVISILLAITPVLATLNERSVEDPIELSVRGMTNDDTLIFAREIEQPPELERRIIGLVKVLAKGAVKAGKAIAKKKAGRGKRDIEYEQDFFERDIEEFEELYDRDYEDIDDLD